MVDNSGQVVTDSKKKVIKKKNKHAAKKKERLAKLCTLIRSFLSLSLESSSLFLSCFVPALILVFVPACVPILMPTFVHIPVPTSVCCLISLAVLLSGRIPALAAFAAFFSFSRTLVFCYRIWTFLLLFSVLGPSLFLRSSSLRIFKQSLLNKSWPRVSTSSTKIFCPFSALGAYNLDNNNGLYNPTNNKRKKDFNTAFINSYLLTSNYDLKEVDLTFSGCKYSDTVELN